MRFVIHLALLAVLSATPGGDTVGSSYVTVRYGPGEDEYGKAVYRAATKARTRIYDNLDITPEEPVVIILAPGGNEGFQAAQPGEANVPDWAVGTAYPQGLTIVLRHPDNIKYRYEELEHVVIHEYTHIAVGVYLGALRPPRWFDEGLATLMARERTFTSSTTIGYAALTNSLIPLDKLADSWPESGTQADLAYAESADFLSWLQAEYGEKTLYLLVHKFKETKDFRETIFSITGYPLEYHQDLWMQTVARKYKWISILTGGFSLWFVATIIFLLGYALKRRRGKLKMKEWELEEQGGLRFGTMKKLFRDDDDDLPPPPSLH